ncbi:hypothetical protein N7492_004017 [Penicillium capsulatum]|uniref:Uncharacterized protein n=1 Tax=Penicillium capsulatum TaxID=69766 RepID=A0A9W9IN37_9EURO|nr:hypothetical protein N7492_004017 [Penicillium capsulatum]KAJ6121408.1 hypothetical protein N7512_003873 [Penicillium capsulatum]
MPSASAVNMQSDQQTEQLQVVGNAFDALLLTVYRLTHRHNELKQHTWDVFTQLTSVVNQLPLEERPQAKEAHQMLLDRQTELCDGFVPDKPRIEERSLNSMEVIKTLAAHQNVDGTTIRAIVDGIKGYKTLFRCSADLSDKPIDSCLLARGPDPSLSLEQDFTTNGPRGNLQCPFSKSQPDLFGKANPMDKSTDRSTDDGPKVSVDTCGHDDLDPIRIERDERRSSTTPSGPTAGSSASCAAARCPIRFLDKHSPEEIAEYVDRHKHDLPRSHTVCIQRYQRDPQNMRKLDNKYGSLTNMISGLSAKHQVFLPIREEGEAQTMNSASSQIVEKWAEAVDSMKPGPADPASAAGAAPVYPDVPVPEDETHSRQGHFERPLREVRVGESPSRPWGIPVPFVEQSTETAPHPASAPTSPEADALGPLEPPAKPAGRCPFGHDAPKPDSAKTAMTQEKSKLPEPEAIPEAPMKPVDQRPPGCDALIASNLAALAMTAENTDAVPDENMGSAYAAGVPGAGPHRVEPSMTDINPRHEGMPMDNYCAEQITYHGPVTYNGTVRYSAPVSVNFHGAVSYSAPVTFNGSVNYSGNVHYRDPPPRDAGINRPVN